jgi:hypothetical protein
MESKERTTMNECARDRKKIYPQKWDNEITNAKNVNLIIHDKFSLLFFSHSNNHLHLFFLCVPLVKTFILPTNENESLSLLKNKKFSSF